MCPYACSRFEWYTWHYKTVYNRYIQAYCLFNRHHTSDLCILVPQLAQQYVSYYVKYNNYKMCIRYVGNTRRRRYMNDLKFSVLW